MVHLVNLNKEDYLAGKIPDKDKIEAAITYDGKYRARIIYYSAEHEIEEESTKKKS